MGKILPPQTPPRVRCAWAGGNALMMDYHDREWGVPQRDDLQLFEFLILEGAQAGLSWQTVLNKREEYRRALHSFNPKRMAQYGAVDAARLMANPGIIRNRLKISAAISNAQAYLRVLDEGGSFSDYLWRFVGGKPIQHGFTSHQQLPATSPESDALSNDLKQRGFRFVGSTICYAFMQATGMVNDHTTDCFRHRELS